jgi:uncharacterized membrane-anchored protein YhcB (DUF1043 family)
MFWIGLVVGLVVGGAVGLIVTALCVAAHNADNCNTNLNNTK